MSWTLMWCGDGVCIPHSIGPRCDDMIMPELWWCDHAWCIQLGRPFIAPLNSLLCFQVWLEPTKPIVKQVRSKSAYFNSILNKWDEWDEMVECYSMSLFLLLCLYVSGPMNTLFRLSVKFFPPDPGQLHEEYTRSVTTQHMICIEWVTNVCIGFKWDSVIILMTWLIETVPMTSNRHCCLLCWININRWHRKPSAVFHRYLFSLQMKRDLIEGRLTCTENTAALLASHLVQCMSTCLPFSVYWTKCYSCIIWSDIDSAAFSKTPAGLINAHVWLVMISMIYLLG